MMILTFNRIYNKNKLTFNNQQYVRDTINSYVYVSVNPVTTIGKCAFNNCMSLTEIVIPDFVTSIGAAAFHNCHSLTKIVIPDLVTTIGASAFHNCYSLTQIVIPDSVTTIGNYVFKYCTSLTTIETNNEDAYIIK